MSEGVDLTHLLEFAEEVARRAGDLLLEGWRGSDGGRGLVTSTKSSPTDLVTELDRASEQLVASAIRDRRPEDGLLGEEGANRPTRSGLTWVIDPLDGTTNFVYGYGSFAVSIALCDDVGSLLGVVHDPLRAETFTAARGRGSSLDGCRLGPLVAAPLAEALIGTGFGYERALRESQGGLLAGLLGEVRDIRRGGSAALDLCGVAAGRLDGYYEAGLAPWDRAAGELVLREAGGMVTEHHGLLPGRPTLVAAPPGTIDALVGVLEAASAAKRAR